MPDLLPSTAYFFPRVIAKPDRDQVAVRESLAEAEISYSARDRQALFTVIFYGLQLLAAKPRNSAQHTANPFPSGQL